MLFKVTQTQKTFNSSKFELAEDMQNITITVTLDNEELLTGVFGEDFDIGDKVEVTFKKI